MGCHWVTLDPSRFCVRQRFGTPEKISSFFMRFKSHCDMS